MTTHLGCDPGQDDAAVAVLARDGATFTLRAASWFRRSTRSKVRGWLVSTWTPHDGLEESWTSSYSEAVSNLGLVAATKVDTAAVEGARFRARGPRKRTPESIASLSVARGRLLQEVAAQVGYDPLEPIPDEWRPLVLRVSKGADGAASKELAQAWVSGRRVMRRKTPGWRLDTWPPDVECSHHVAEAVCLGVYGALVEVSSNGD